MAQKRLRRDTYLPESPGPRLAPEKFTNKHSTLCLAISEVAAPESPADGRRMNRFTEHENRSPKDIVNAESKSVESSYPRKAFLADEVLLRGKWKVEILCAMRTGPVRLG